MATDPSNHEEPAILTIRDTVSPIPPTNEDNENPQPHSSKVVPVLHTPFGFDNAQDYFSNRNGLVEAAIQECLSTLIFPSEDGEVVGSWLLTEISLWDNEKEHIIILTKKSLMIIKYDFITMKQLEFKKVILQQVDTVVIGKLIYPKASLVPRINGIINGISTVVRECVVNRNSQTKSQPKGDEETQEGKTIGPINLKHFESRDRNMNGVRVMYNRGQQLDLLKQWNPFDKNIPFNTFTFHPLYFHKDNSDNLKNIYNVENFSQAIIDTMDEVETDTPCIIHHNPIVLQCYVGLLSLVHNKTSLGFFKVRGKFSF